MTAAIVLLYSVACTVSSSLIYSQTTALNASVSHPGIIKPSMLSQGCIAGHQIDMA